MAVRVEKAVVSARSASTGRSSTSVDCDDEVLLIDAPHDAALIVEAAGG
jgi:hypothetical protein